jgi:hypothetical protein
MSLNVYFKKEGDLWLDSIPDFDKVQFNFVQVDNEEQYEAMVSLLQAKQNKLHSVLKKKIKESVESS